MAPGTASQPSTWPQGGGSEKEAAVPGAGQAGPSVTQVRGMVNSVVVVLRVLG